MSVTYETQRISTSNYTKGREGKKPTKIVIHHWGGWGQSFNGVRDWLSVKPDAKASIHWVVQGKNADASNSARACSIVDEVDTAWHAGHWATNLESIGIECRPEAYGADYLAIAEVVKGVRSRWGNLPLTEHNDFTSTDCPGQWDIVQIDRLARGLSRGACTRATWRGVVVCKHSVYKLNLWAIGVGNDIRLTPLAGCGSYQTDTEASAGTHAGGGAIDISTVGYTMEQRDKIERVARLVGLQIAWERDRISGLWTWHIHALDPQCPNLSSEARTQCIEFGNGGDGLVGTKPDPGIRTNATSLMRIYNNRITSGTVTAVPVLEDDMPTIKDFWDYPVALSDSVARLMGKKSGSSWSAKGLLMYGNAAFWTLKGVVEPKLNTMSGQIAGLTTLVTEMANKQGLDGEALVAAIKQSAFEGAKAGVDAEIDGATVTLRQAIAETDESTP